MYGVRADSTCGRYIGDMAHEEVSHFGGTFTPVSKADTADLYHRIACGHCGTTVGAAVIARAANVYWLRCPVCYGGTVLAARPTYGPQRNVYYEQHPMRLPLEDIKHLPAEVEHAYRDARRCFSVSAYGATETLCRKLLAHAATDKGAAPGLTFVQYVEHLESEGLITSPMKGWADLIRKHGNSAVHDLEEVDQQRAKATLEFTAQLLRIAYEMPGMAAAYLT